jgi:hypothetical protein
MSVEAAVSLFAAWRARSPALLAFGGDSAIELFSAVVVLWRFRATAASAPFFSEAYETPSPLPAVPLLKPAIFSSNFCIASFATAGAVWR